MFYNYNVSKIVGRPLSDIMSRVTDYIINYITENSEECQFSLKFLIAEYRKQFEEPSIPKLDRVEAALKSHFGAEIIIESTTTDKLMCFKRTLGKIIEDQWYADRDSNDNNDRKRVVDMAANIILQDIRAKIFEIDDYKSPSSFLNNVEDDMPESLKLFLNTVIKTHKHTPKSGSWANWDKKVCSVGHIIMSAVRPRSFISPLLLSLSTLIHTKFAARTLIDALHNLCLCESYSETQRLEKSVVRD